MRGSRGWLRTRNRGGRWQRNERIRGSEIGEQVMKGILDALNYSPRTIPTQVQSIAGQEVALDLSSSHKGWIG